MLCFCKAAVLLLKLGSLTVLTVEYLRDLDAGKVLGEEGVDIGGRVLHLTVRTARELSEYQSEKKDKRSEAKHHQSELIVKKKHRAENAEDGKAILHEVNEKICKHHRDGVGIVGNSGNELAYGDLMQLRV